MTNKLTDYTGDTCIVITVVQGQPVDISVCESSERARENIFLENDSVVKMYSSENMHIFKQHETETEWVIIDCEHFMLHHPIPDGELVISNDNMRLPGLNVEYIPDENSALNRSHVLYDAYKHCLKNIIIKFPD